MTGVHRSPSLPGFLEDAAVVVFDLDGTLYDDEMYLRGADDAIAALVADRGFGDRVTARSALADAVADGGRDGYLDRFCQAMELERSMMPELLDALRTARPELEVFEWAPELLRSLAQRGTHLWILTNGNVAQQRNKVDLLGIESRPTPVRVVFANELRPKPAPDGLAHILASEGVKAVDVVLVGNAPEDAECAAACGVAFVHVDVLIAALP
jgi:phosphoglycolate phosphatase-like HAD superfamily hydrolase